LARAVRVVVDVPALDRVFDYLVPAGLAADVGVGTLVRIPLLGRRVAGWVVADHVTPPAGVSLRPLASVTGRGPTPELVDLTKWAAWRWAGRRSSLLRTASPARAVRGLPSPPGRAQPAPAPPDEMSGDALDAGAVAIVAGFQGVSQDTKDITTLGRGGSDTTAVALAAALHRHGARRQAGRHDGCRLDRADRARRDPRPLNAG